MAHQSTVAAPGIQPQAINEAEAAKYIGLSRSFLRAGRLGRCDGPPFIRAGRAVRYLISDLDTWLQARKVRGARVA